MKPFENSILEALPRIFMELAEKLLEMAVEQAKAIIRTICSGFQSGTNLKVYGY